MENFLTTRFVENNTNLMLSSLSKLEMHCALRRRTRAGEITTQYKQLAVDAFNQQLVSSYYQVLRIETIFYEKASDLIDEVTPALRTLDALHLAVAQASNINELVTADKVMAIAAKELNFIVHYFE